ncbi:MAG: DNA alkylation repair protein [Muribaculaceae bacterium]|nr:DNA alkylation repair protein [Muribaculaceae bacterium]
MIVDEIRQRLVELRDDKNAPFVSKLFPTIEPNKVLGIRTPVLRSLAKDVIKRPDLQEFFADVPHHFFEENQLHAFIISLMRDYDVCIAELERFLPYVDNWATCDQMSPKVFAKRKKDLFPHITAWMKSKHEYTIRFAMCRLMSLYLDEDFEPRHLEMVAQVSRDEYYVKMMQAWYFATALAKQPTAALPYIEKRQLKPWTHNKAIQKAVESYRIDDEMKAYLKSLKTTAKR